MPAKVHRLGGYCAHADQRGGIGERDAGKAGRIERVHGEKPAREAPADLLRTQGHRVPDDDEPPTEQ